MSKTGIFPNWHKLCFKHSMKTQAMGGNIAVTVWGERVSPVFDSARTLLIAHIDGNILNGTSQVAFNPDRPLEFLHLLRAQQVVLIICGAVSEGPAAMIEAAGVKLIPFIAGDVQQVLGHYLQGRPFSGQFRMPGCGKNVCCRGKIRRGHGLRSFAQVADNETKPPQDEMTAATEIPQK